MGQWRSCARSSSAKESGSVMVRTAYVFVGPTITLPLTSATLSRTANGRPETSTSRRRRANASPSAIRHTRVGGQARAHRLGASSSQVPRPRWALAPACWWRDDLATAPVARYTGWRRSHGRALRLHAARRVPRPDENRSTYGVSKCSCEALQQPIVGRGVVGIELGEGDRDQSRG
jgi:hypothetical protein